MDLKKYYNEKIFTHWAQQLEVGDRCLATIRHATDGSKNLKDKEVIVIQNNLDSKTIICWLAPNEYHVPYNELTKI